MVVYNVAEKYRQFQKCQVGSTALVNPLLSSYISKGCSNGFVVVVVEFESIMRSSVCLRTLTFFCVLKFARSFIPSGEASNSVTLLLYLNWCGFENMNLQKVVDLLMLLSHCLPFFSLFTLSKSKSRNNCWINTLHLILHSIS